MLTESCDLHGKPSQLGHFYTNKQLLNFKRFSNYGLKKVIYLLVFNFFQKYYFHSFHPGFHSFDQCLQLMITSEGRSKNWRNDRKLGLHRQLSFHNNWTLKLINYGTFFYWFKCRVFYSICNQCKCNPKIFKPERWIFQIITVLRF